LHQHAHLKIPRIIRRAGERRDFLFGWLGCEYDIQADFLKRRAILFE
jgi:hypothetical protein